MDGEFVDRLVANTVKPVRVNEDTWVPQGWKRDRFDPPAPLHINTLTGVVDYLAANRDGLTLNTLSVVVEGPTRVYVASALNADGDQFRHAYLEATCEKGVSFGIWKNPEDFIIDLLSGYDTGGDRQPVLDLVGGLKGEAVREDTDDGYGQSVTSRKSITSVAATKVENPVSLQPWRTFREVYQPVSDFVVRFRGGGEGVKPLVALFEADGGTWRNAAILSIRDWLRSELPKEVLVVA